MNRLKIRPGKEGIGYPPCGTRVSDWRLRDIRRIVSRVCLDPDWYGTSPDVWGRGERRKGFATSHGLEYNILEYVETEWGRDTSGTPVCLLPQGFRARLLSVEDAKQLLAKIDRAISKFGPDYTIAWVGEYRPKDTTDVTECMNGTSNDVHGGDGNSGECDHAAETLPNQIRQAGEPSGEDETGANQASLTKEQPSQPEKGEQRESACAAPDIAEDEPTASNGTGESDRGANNPTPYNTESPASEPLEDDEVPEAHADQPGSESRDAQYCENEPKEGDNDAPIGSGEDERHSSGNSESDRLNSNRSDVDSASCVGREPTQEDNPYLAICFAREEEALKRSKFLNKEAREIVSMLRKIVRRVVGGGHEPSPRMSANKFVKELVASSYRLSRTRRSEMQSGLIVLSPDLSGSCSACADDTYAAAFATCAAMPNSCKIITNEDGIASNGTLYGAPLDEVLPPQTQMVIIWADWQGGEAYRRICQSGIRLIWLDCYGKIGGVRPSSDAKKGLFRGWRNLPIKFDGVGSARDTAIALRMALKELL